MLNQFLQDEGGFVISSELVLVATIVVIGMISGLTTVRDQVSLELADVADAISEINHSYSFGGVTAHSASTAGSFFQDRPDFCEDASDDQQGAGGTQCLLPNSPPTSEEQ